MPTNRDLPHVRAEWLPSLLAGEHACEWAVWFRVHHPDQVAPPSSDDEATALLDQQKAEWAERDYEVSTDNAFLLRSRTAVLTGTPEIIVSRDDHVLIISGPTGPPLPPRNGLPQILPPGFLRVLDPLRPASANLDPANVHALPLEPNCPRGTQLQDPKHPPELPLPPPALSSPAGSPPTLPTPNGGCHRPRHSIPTAKP